MGVYDTVKSETFINILNHFGMFTMYIEYCILFNIILYNGIIVLKVSFPFGVYIQEKHIF